MSKSFFNTEGEFVDYYATLGAKPTATTREIREAYQALAAIALKKPILEDDEPDPTGSSRYDRVHEAYELLTNFKKRSEFDLARQERELEQQRIRSSIPKKIRYTMEEAPIPRNTILFWIKKVKLSMDTLLWHRLDFVEKCLESPSMDKILLAELYKWQDNARLCWMRLEQLKRTAEVKAEWDEKSEEAILMGREVLRLRDGCVFWLELADYLVEVAPKWFAEDGFFRRPDDFVGKCMCQDKMAELFMWDQFRYFEPRAST